MRMIMAAAICVSCLALNGCQTAPPAAPVLPSWTIPEGVATIPVNGYPMAYLSRGSGPTLVMVAGTMADYRYWAPQIQAYSSDFRVISVSLRHFYPELWDGKGSDFSVSQHARDVARFIEQISPPVYLLGHSYGGHIAYEVARTRPELVRKLILVEPALDGVQKVPSDRGSPDSMKFFDAGDIETGLASAVDKINGPGAWARTPETFRVTLRQNAWTVPGVTRDTPAPVKCDQIGALPMPVMFLTGETTSPRYKDLVPAAASCLPRAQVVVIPKAGHVMNYQNPSAFNAAVIGFLK